MTVQPTTIQLSLVSHTNTGKTTLARSLIGRDVGEIRDEAHVTALAECHRMIETADGHVLNLWDTPGFGDSARLIKRLRLQGNPVGWLLSEVWDRWRDRPFWSSQQAIRNVREQADVVLYLVNASEKPGEAGYVAPEMEILAWIGKPVLVLLNQLGEPRPGDQDAADEALWRRHLTPYPFVRQILPLDAFARCWVQEFALFDAVAPCLPEASQPAFTELSAAWRQRRLDTFHAAMASLADFLTRAATDSEALPEAGLGGTLRRLGAAIGIGSAASPQQQAMESLAGRLEAEIRRSTDQLIELHGLGGRAAQEVHERLAGDFAAREKIGESSAALVGGVMSGALSGLAADLAAGGLTLGAGAVIGAIAGAVGSAGAAHAANRLRGIDDNRLHWSVDSLERLFTASLLRYLAVAHYGRGRGEWRQTPLPEHWRALVEEAVMEAREALVKAWPDGKDEAAVAESRERLQALLARTGTVVLQRLYPQAGEALKPH